MAPPRYNVAPTQEVPIVRRGRDGRRQAVFARWGLIPPDRGGGGRGPARTINARAETVFTRALFRRAVRERRCLIPATGFLEWEKRGRARFPMHVRPSAGAVWAMAGIWSRWRMADGSWRLTCSVLTTKPNEKVAPLHDRMPVILAEDAYGGWLDPSVTDREILEPLLVAIGAEHATLEPVSARVNHVGNDDPACLEVRATDAPASRSQLGFNFS